MRRPVVLWTVILSALALAACGGHDKDTDRPLPPDLASNFNQPIDGRGADPSWTLSIRGLDLTLSRPNQPDAIGKAPGVALQAHAASWVAALPDGQTMTVNLYASDCSDRVSGLSYPFQAEVKFARETPLVGCAGPAAGVKR